MVREQRISGAWRQLEVLNSTAPAARGGHSMVAVGNAILVCGGTDRNLSVCGHAHLLELGEKSRRYEWSQLATTQDGEQFSLSRTGFTLITIENHVFLFGGQDPDTGLCYNDVKRLNPAEGRWEKIPPVSGRPAPRHAHCSALVGSHSFVVFGGANQSNEVLGDVWVFNTRTSEWKHVVLGGEMPVGREMSAAASLPDSRIIISGGRSAAGNILSDAYLMEFNSGTSRSLTKNPLLARCSHTAVSCELPLGGAKDTQCCVMFGGFVGAGLSQDLVIVSTDDGTCIHVDDCEDSDERPAGRFAHAACTMNADSRTCIYFFGGMGQEVDYQDMMSWTPRECLDQQN